jgi:hypothetical protein
MKYTDLYQLIEQDVFGFLASDPIMGQRAGAVIEPGSVASAIQKAVTKAIGAGVDGKVGIGWLVLPIEDLIDADPEVTFGPLKLPICVQIVENTLLNQGPHGPKLPIRVLAAYAEKILKAYSAQNLTTDLIPEKNAISLFTPDKDDHPNMRVCQINLFTYESDPVAFTQVSSPYLTPDHTLGNAYPYFVTIAAPDADEVWWTVDGSNPWAGTKAIQTSATLWDGNPVPVTGQCLFRARGFAAGEVGSKCSSIYFGGVDAAQVYPSGSAPPLLIVDGALVPTVDDSGAILVWPFRDQVTGEIAYLRIKDKAVDVQDV